MRRFYFLLSILLFVANSVVHAQSAPTLGFDPYSTFHKGGADSINMANGNAVVKIPLFSLPQAGAFAPIT